MMQPMNKMDFFSETLVHINDFELQDFIENPNFDHQFMNLIRGENENVNSSDLMNGFFGDNTSHLCNNNSVNSSLGSFSCFDGEVKGKEENDEDNSSSATTTTITTSVNTKTRSKTKTDRSKTLVSERKRRGRMKDKLYALRSLVPNITKMDKASIIGDAASYVNELQSQANKLKVEVAGLEASLTLSKNHQGSIENPIKDIQFTYNNCLICKKIVQMDMFQVDERGFYVKIVCIKGEGVAASLSLLIL